MVFPFIFPRTVPSAWSRWGVHLDTRVQVWGLCHGRSPLADWHSVDTSTISSVWWPCITMETRMAGRSETEHITLHCLLTLERIRSRITPLLSLQCPTCKTIYGVKTGNQPAGKMEYHIIPHSLPGHSDCKTIRIIYNIPPGIQVLPRPFKSLFRLQEHVSSRDKCSKYSANRNAHWGKVVGESASWVVLWFWECWSWKCLEGNSVFLTYKSWRQIFLLQYKPVGHRACVGLFLHTVWWLESGWPAWVIKSITFQGPEHPNPGKPFTARGFPRHCYLPDSEKGRKVNTTYRQTVYILSCYTMYIMFKGIFFILSSH